MMEILLNKIKSKINTMECVNIILFVKYTGKMHRKQAVIVYLKMVQ
jgi:hypothetical protein